MTKMICPKAKTCKAACRHKKLHKADSTCKRECLREGYPTCEETQNIFITTWGCITFVFYMLFSKKFREEFIMGVNN